jgi:hypothetical protein
MVVIGEGIFSGTGNLVLVGWLALAVGAAMPRSGVWGRRLVAAGGFGVPLAVAAAYLTLLVLLAQRKSEGHLFSLAGIADRFASRDHLFALYIEALALSLFAARWVVEDVARRGMSRWILVPVLPAMFLFGPAGLLFYVLAASVGGRLLGSARQAQA